MPSVCGCGLKYESLVFALDRLAVNVEEEHTDLAENSLDITKEILPEVQEECALDLGSARASVDAIEEPLKRYATALRELGEPAAREVEVVRENVLATVRSVKPDVAGKVLAARSAVHDTMETCATKACDCGRAYVDLGTVMEDLNRAVASANPADLTEAQGPISMSQPGRHLSLFATAVDRTVAACDLPKPKPLVEAGEPVEHVALVEKELERILELAPLARSPTRRKSRYMKIRVPGEIVAKPKEILMHVPGRVIEMTPTFRIKIAPKVVQEIIQPDIVRGPPETRFIRVRRSPEEKEYDETADRLLDAALGLAVALEEAGRACAVGERGKAMP